MGQGARDLKLLASGRDADVFALSDRLVLRRARDGRSLAAEARLMSHVRTHGYPVPAIESVSDDGAEIVMERVDGPSMGDRLTARPWQLGASARTLASLHHRLAEVPAPDWLPAWPGSDGSAVLHLDLHPFNVLIGPAGPQVIDWANAARGSAPVDAALTWVILASATIPGGGVRARVMSAFRRRFVDAFVAGFDREALVPYVRECVDWKVQDRNMSAAERDAMRQMADAVS